MRCMMWCHKVICHTKYEGCSPYGSWATGIYAYLRSKVIQVTWHFVSKLCSHSNLCVPKVTPVALLVCLELHMLMYMMLHHEVHHCTKYEGAMWLLIYRYRCIFGVIWHFVKKFSSHSYPWVPNISPLALLASPELDMHVINEVHDVVS